MGLVKVRLNIPVLIALLSNIIQHFEYAMFGISSAIITKIFFPPGEFIDRLIGFYFILLLSVLFRPIGSYIFGRIGDEYGRSKAFKLGMTISAIATIVIGIIPGFDNIGYFSILLVLICRISLIMTGQIDNVTIYITETIPKNYENLASGLISLSLQFGIFLASLIYSLTDDIEISGLWRLNFIISGILGLVIMLMRRFIVETKEYRKYKAEKPRYESIINIIGSNKRDFVRAMMIHGSIGGMYNFFILFFINYVGRVVEIASISMLNLATNIGIACCAFLAPLAGLIADKTNPHKQIFYSLIICLLIAIINIIYIDQFIYPFYGHIALMAVYPFFTAPIIIYLKKLFSVGVRMRLYSLSHTFGSTILSTTTPIIATILWKYTGNITAPFIYFLILNILLLITCPKS